MSLETPTRPRGLREVILLMCALTLVPVLWIDAIMPNSRSSGFALYGVFSALWLLVVWFLWQGRNWARTVILFFSALAIPSIVFELFAVPVTAPQREQTTLQQAVTVIDTLLLIFLLYWLNTGPVKECFKSVQPVAPHDSTLPPIPEP